MSEKKGILYGLGMGPGDPELITAKAARILAHADLVFAAASTKNDYSLALSIATPHLPPATEVVRLSFPMTRDEGELAGAWRANAALVARALGQGKTCAFITLGDPMTYSTFGYLRREVLAVMPEAVVKAVPGITAPQAAAAAVCQSLAENGESFAVISGVGDTDKIRAVLETVDAAAILKTYREFPKIRALLRDMGLSQSATFATRLGMHGQRVGVSLDSVDETPSYFSLILVKKTKP